MAEARQAGRATFSERPPGSVTSPPRTLIERWLAKATSAANTISLTTSYRVIESDPEVRRRLAAIPISRGDTKAKQLAEAIRRRERGDLVPRRLRQRMEEHAERDRMDGIEMMRTCPARHQARQPRSAMKSRGANRQRFRRRGSSPSVAGTASPRAISGSRLSLPRHCHAERETEGSGGRRRERHGAQLVVVTAGSRIS